MMKKQLLAAAVAGLGLAISGSASAYSIGGVEFGNVSNSGGPAHIETTTLAETSITGSGDMILGYGVVNTVNGNSSYAGTNKLYFIFDNYVADTFSSSAATFSGGRVRIFLHSEFNLLNQASDGVGGNLDLIDDGILWVTMKGHASSTTGNMLDAAGTLTGASPSFTGTGLLDVDKTLGTGLLSVQNALDANTVVDGLGIVSPIGLADVILTTSANNFFLNPFDVANGSTAHCNSPTQKTGEWCFQGSADLRGNYIPEPSALALMGLGLLGLVTARRKANAE